MEPKKGEGKAKLLGEAIADTFDDDKIVTTLTRKITHQVRDLDEAVSKEQLIQAVLRECKPMQSDVFG